MSEPDSIITREGRWTSLWVVAFVSLLGQLALCQFFTLSSDGAPGQTVPMTIDMNPSNLWKLAYQFPPTGVFLVLNWLGGQNPGAALNPFSLAANLPAWLFFTAYAPIMGTCALLAMAAFLRELELPRPAALFGAVVYAWQGDILPFVFPGHFAYITFWPFFALAAWGALRAQRTGHWAYALISGVSCGTMVQLPTTADRGAIASIFIAGLYLAPVVWTQKNSRAGTQLLHLAICVVTALLVAMTAIMALFQIQISGVKMGGHTHFQETYNFCTQFSLGPWETFTYPIPGLFGWHTNSYVGPYWGWIGQSPDWGMRHDGMRNFNEAISTTGTVATVLALIGGIILLPGSLLGLASMSDRSRFYARVLLIFGVIGLVLSWGYHTPLYRPLFALPFMDKWRNPLKWLEITNFALATLSAFGVRHLMASLASDSPALPIIRLRVARFSGIILGLLVFALALSFPAGIILSTSLKVEGYTPEALPHIIGTTHTSLGLASLVMGGFCLVLYCLWSPERMSAMTLTNPLINRVWQVMFQVRYQPLTLAVGMALLSVVQLAWVDTHFIEPANLSALTATNPLLETLKHEGDQVRVSVAVEDPFLSILLQNQFNADRISSIDISAASRIPDDINAFFNALGADRERLWFLAGVKNVAIPQEFMPQLRADPILAANIASADGYSLIPTRNPDLPSHALVVMRDFLAKATLVPNAEFIASPGDMLKRLDDRAWDPRQSVLLDPAQKRSYQAVMDDTLARPSQQDAVVVETYTPTEIELKVESTKGGYVLINDHYDTDWQVQVNGHDADLLRADYLMRAVEVPPGDSQITMKYVAHYHVAGLNLPSLPLNLFSDAIMLAAWIIAGLALLRQRSPQP